jgi:hypothetical protein
MRTFSPLKCPCPRVLLPGVAPVGQKSGDGRAIVGAPAVDIVSYLSPILFVAVLGASPSSAFLSTLLNTKMGLRCVWI